MENLHLITDARKTIQYWQRAIAELYVLLDGADALRANEKQTLYQMHDDMYRVMDNLKKLEGSEL